MLLRRRLAGVAPGLLLSSALLLLPACGGSSGGSSDGDSSGGGPNKPDPKPPVVTPENPQPPAPKPPELAALDSRFQILNGELADKSKPSVYNVNPMSGVETDGEVYGIGLFDSGEWPIDFVVDQENDTLKLGKHRDLSENARQYSKSGAFSLLLSRENGLILIRSGEEKKISGDIKIGEQSRVLISPDEKYILMHSDPVAIKNSNLTDSELYLYSVATGELKQITPTDSETNVISRSYKFSPDSQKVYYIVETEYSPRGDTKGFLYSASVDGSDHKKIYEGVQKYEFSPDGSHVAIANYSSLIRHFRLISLDDERVQRLDPGAPVQIVKVTENHIFYISSRKIYKVKYQGVEDEFIGGGAIVLNKNAEDQILYAGWSALIGEYIYFSRAYTASSGSSDRNLYQLSLANDQVVALNKDYSYSSESSLNYRFIRHLQGQDAVIYQKYEKNKQDKLVTKPIINKFDGITEEVTLNLPDEYVFDQYELTNDTKKLVIHAKKINPQSTEHTFGLFISDIDGKNLKQIKPETEGPAYSSKHRVYAWIDNKVYFSYGRTGETFYVYDTASGKSTELLQRFDRFISSDITDVYTSESPELDITHVGISLTRTDLGFSVRRAADGKRCDIVSDNPAIELNADKSYTLITDELFLYRQREFDHESGKTSVKMMKLDLNTCESVDISGPYWNHREGNQYLSAHMIRRDADNLWIMDKMGIYQMDNAGKELTALYEFETTSQNRVISKAKISKDWNKLLYWAFDAQRRYSLFALDLDNKSEVQITPDSVIGNYSSYSSSKYTSDDQWVVYRAKDKQSDTLQFYKTKIDGSETVALPLPDKVEGIAHWYLDNDEKNIIAYGARSKAHSLTGNEFYAISLADGSSVILAGQHQEGPVNSPQYHPASDAYIYMGVTKSDDKVINFYAAKADGSAVAKLTDFTEESRSLYSASMHLGGDSIFYISDELRYKPEVYTIATTGASTRTLLAEGRYDSLVVIPDSQQFAYVSPAAEDGSYSLVLQNMGDGQVVGSVPLPGRIRALALRPDGKSLTVLGGLRTYGQLEAAKIELSAIR